MRDAEGFKIDLQETQTKLKVANIINPLGTWRQPLGAMCRDDTVQYILTIVLTIFFSEIF